MFVLPSEDCFANGGGANFRFPSRVRRSSRCHYDGDILPPCDKQGRRYWEWSRQEGHPLEKVRSPEPPCTTCNNTGSPSPCPPSPASFIGRSPSGFRQETEIFRSARGLPASSSRAQKCSRVDQGQSGSRLAATSRISWSFLFSASVQALINTMSEAPATPWESWS